MITNIITNRPATERTIRSAYGDQKRVVSPIVGPSRTKQQFRDATDINLIMETYEKTGVLTSINANEPQYGFVPNIDFQEALDTVNQAQETFMQLSADTRKRFNNNPSELITFMQNPENLEEAYDLGLAIRPEREQNPAEAARNAEPQAPADENPQPVTT